LTNILTAAGLEAGGARPRHVEDLAEDVRHAVDAFRERCAAAELETHADGLACCPVRRDPAAIRIVLHNLLDNAVKYTPPGGRIEIRLLAEDTDAVLSVADNGRGIAAADVERIFGRFERGTESEHLGGTGLGLALVRELVQSHGGSVSVRSDGPGKGACFTLRLPLAEGPA
jgi:signal transduction histidine kinase